MNEQQLPVPSFTPQQVEWVINFANNQLPTIYGNQLLEFVKKVAIENVKQTEADSPSV